MKFLNIKHENKRVFTIHEHFVLYVFHVINGTCSNDRCLDLFLDAVIALISSKCHGE